MFSAASGMVIPASERLFRAAQTIERCDCVCSACAKGDEAVACAVAWNALPVGLLLDCAVAVNGDGGRSVCKGNVVAMVGV